MNFEVGDIVLIIGSGDIGIVDELPDEAGEYMVTSDLNRELYPSWTTAGGLVLVARSKEGKDAYSELARRMRNIENEKEND